MDSNGLYAVSGVHVSQSPFITDAGNVTQAYNLTFKVGTHGPFSVAFTAGKPTPAEVLAIIQAQVADLRQLDAGVAQLNQQP